MTSKGYGGAGVPRKQTPVSLRDVPSRRERVFRDENGFA